jgi:stage III sporulation protein AE
MIKKITISFLIFINIINFCYGTDELLEESKEIFGINDFIAEAKKYTSEVFPDLELDNLLTSSTTGNIDLSFVKKAINRLLGTEIMQALRLMISVLIVIIINSVCKAIIENLGNEETAKIVYLLQYLIIAILIITSFLSILDITKEAINKLTNFMNLLVPLFTTLILTTGSIASTNIIQPILLFAINFTGNFCNNFLIPILLTSLALSIVSNISERAQISGLAKFLKSSIVWCLGIVLTIFTCLLSLEGTLGASVDGLTSKTTKAVVTNFIPVVGKILGDTVETVIGCSNILKNTVGFIGVIIIIGIVLVPIIKIAVFTICFKLTASLGEAVADSKIIKLISEISENYQILLGILISASVMFIIGITLVLKISNSSLMYR